MNGDTTGQNGHAVQQNGDVPLENGDVEFGVRKPGGYYSVGANPPPAWSNYIGPEHKAPPPVATQLVVPTQLSDGPVDLTCIHCQHHVTTRIKTKSSGLTWAICTCLCLVGVCLPCACIPFCMDKFKVTEHYCSNCGILLGKYKGWKGRADP
eukprot:TRINITY_DN11746_c0_g1_i1.p1 TRINITY_DN11746_c0_g1~~TRINITY_DN11746_c0_g1_i1.p1  ORF type:complete len:152 (-),score=14.75 TRINITY_DN11746_c0_g1_i1:594-1049(-)